MVLQDGSQDDGASVVLHTKHGGQNQLFILEKWNNNIKFLLRASKYCIYLITNEPDKMFTSLNFSSIPEKLMVSLI